MYICVKNSNKPFTQLAKTVAMAKFDTCLKTRNALTDCQ